MATARMQGVRDGMERLVVSIRFPVLVTSGGLDGEEALRVAFVGIFSSRWHGVATFIESTLRSVSQHLLSATVPWKARVTDDSGAWAMCRATGRATDGASSRRERL